MFFAAGYPKAESLDKKFTPTDNTTRVVVWGNLDGPDGVHRDLVAEAVYSDTEVLYTYYHTAQRLNFGSGWKSDSQCEGNRSLGTVEIDKSAEYYATPESVLATLDGEFRGPVYIAPAKPEIVAAVIKKTISEAKNGRLAAFTTKQLKGEEPIPDSEPAPPSPEAKRPPLA